MRFDSTTVFQDKKVLLDCRIIVLYTVTVPYCCIAQCGALTYKAGGGDSERGNYLEKGSSVSVPLPDAQWSNDLTTLGPPVLHQ